MFGITKIGPIFYNKTDLSSSQRYVGNLQELLKYTDGSIIKKEVEDELWKYKKGIDGEDNIIFQLENSDIDMYFLHDIELKFNDLDAQIDFIIITRKKIYVIECKNYSNDIKVKDTGDFILIKNDGTEEGIESPVSQNQRHINILKQVRTKDKENSNIIIRKLFDNNFEDMHKSLVVFTNSKSIINLDNANTDIKNKVIKSDQLINKIKEIEKNCKDANFTDKQMIDLAEYFHSLNNTEKADQRFIDLMNKYKTQREAELFNRIQVQSEKTCPQCNAKLMIKVATKGDRLGKKFYGCSRYPECTFVENIDKD